MTATTTRRPTGHLSRDERVARGRAARKARPRADHAALPPTVGRTDPVSLLEEQATTRVPELVPIRYGRMLTSPFAFYRGAALIMATDLATVPRSGLDTQLCGDAHLSNFGVFGTPERRLVFDINDFDETAARALRVGRQAAGGEPGGRRPRQRLHGKERRGIVLDRGDGLPRGDARRSPAQSNLAVWYAHIDAEQVIAEVAVPARPPEPQQARPRRRWRRPRTRDSLQALAKLTTMVDGQPRIRQRPAAGGADRGAVARRRSATRSTREMRGLIRVLPAHPAADRRHPAGPVPLSRWPARWWGSAASAPAPGSCCCEGVDGGDPLFLQAKEAAAVGAGGLRRRAAAYANHGQRVVAGQQLMQAASDIFLGWQRSTGCRRRRARLLRPPAARRKGSVAVEKMVPDGMALYAPPVRLDAGPRPRPLRRPGRDRGLPRLQATPSTRPSPTSRRPTPTRTSATTPPCGAAVEAGRVEATPGV